ncbi:MAG: hypothetical protein UX45_C0024G0013 [Candidatus Uhrbacteria bacterium GW2011_GWF2_46_218]|uniref:Uncharacterized protein n=1 Tax=Candidatus Uhrbacteria bacterium GW2011_GWF2_46_218 TaxID=1619001 RepID=A0A0G1PH43_9BACT|nr:MAG: hypothetical protein UX45_C0024G0013 [Candidatus Uhrbacteria bacterium GW2011_GWF2_46_218]
MDLTATGAFAIDGDLVVIGNAGVDGDVADGDNDLLVAGVLEVDGEFELDGSLDADVTTLLPQEIMPKPFILRQPQVALILPQQVPQQARTLILLLQDLP